MVARIDYDLKERVRDDIARFRFTCPTRKSRDEMLRMDKKLTNMEIAVSKGHYSNHLCICFARIQIAKILMPFPDKFHLDAQAAANFARYQMLYKSITMRKRNPVPPSFNIPGLLKSYAPLIQGNPDANVVNTKAEIDKKLSKMENILCVDKGYSQFFRFFFPINTNCIANNNLFFRYLLFIIEELYQTICLISITT